MSYLRSRFSKLDLINLITWRIPFIGAIIFGAALLFANLKGFLPYLNDIDEPLYWRWSVLIRQTGSAASEQGAGYPPGFLYLLIVEQVFLEMIKKDAIPPAEYFLFAHYINIIFAIGAIICSGLIVRAISGYKLAGIVASLATALNLVFFLESRRVAANAPWMFFTLISMYFAIIARQPLRYYWVYASLITALLSVLFKYQSGMIALLPFIVALRYDWQNKRRLVKHLGVLTSIALLTFLWLVFIYHAFEIVHTPDSGTRVLIEREGFQFISLQGNLTMLFRELGGDTFYFTLLGGGIALPLLVFFRKPHIDREGLSWIMVFCLIFYVLMSIFYVVLPTKWLPVIIFLLCLWSIAISTIAQFATEVISFFIKKPAWNHWIALSANLIAIFLFALPYLAPRLYNIQANINTYNKTYSYATLGNWFIANVPQGARTIAEVSHPFNSFAGFPGRQIYHAYIVESIFQENFDEYRQRGYEYLIWDSRKSNSSDQLADLDQPVYRERLKKTKEVLRITGTSYYGPDIVVFQLPPIQQNTLYTQFGNAVSFRGYDLDSIQYQPGDQLSIRLYWMSAETTKANYIVFVHLSSADAQQLLSGHDSPPANGTRPTWSWAGDMQFIRDEHIVSIPSQTPNGMYTISIGMYDADTYERVQIQSPHGEALGDKIALQQIEVKK